MQVAACCYVSNNCSCRSSNRLDRCDRLADDRFETAAAEAASMRVAPAATAARTSLVVSSPRYLATEIRMSKRRRSCVWPSGESRLCHIACQRADPGAGVLRIRSAARSSKTSNCSRSASAASTTSGRRSSIDIVRTCAAYRLRQTCGPIRHCDKSSRRMSSQRR